MPSKTRKQDLSPAAPAFKALKLPDLPTLGERLKWARDRAGLGSAELSIAAGFSHGTVSRIEAKPTAKVEASTLFELAAQLTPGESTERVAVFAWWLGLGYARGEDYGSKRGRKPRATAVPETDAPTA